MFVEWEVKMDLPRQDPREMTDEETPLEGLRFFNGRAHTGLSNGVNLW